MKSIAHVCGLLLAVVSFAAPAQPIPPVGATVVRTSSGTVAAAGKVISGPIWTEEARLLASDGARNDNFGFRVALSGERALVGAYFDDDLGPSSGSAYVFERQIDDRWHEVAKITASDGTEADLFGYSVAVAGETALVGAPWDDDHGTDSGSAYVIERRPDGAWAEVAKLTASDGAAGDEFGEAGVLSGKRALVGAYFADPSEPDAGAAYVFERQPDGAWSEVAKLTASDGEAGDIFGWAASLDGDRALVGAPWDDELGIDSGSAYVYERQSDGSWSEVAKLTAPDGALGDQFGISAALSGERALIGTSVADAGLDSGSAHVFERQADGEWAEVAKLTASDGEPGELFAYSVALANRRAVVGAPFDDDGAEHSGSAYVFERQADDTWRETTKLTASDGMRGDEFGISVALSGRRVLAGAWKDNDFGFDSGSAYVFASEGCELRLALQRPRLRAGDTLRVGVDLVHRRPVIVTVPLALWVEDDAGHKVVHRDSAPRELEPDDRLRVTLAVLLPPDLPAGEYRAVVGVERMEQGMAIESRTFWVDE